ncbi:MAG: hypothetical protein DWQ58_11610 [Microcystis aeruginosa TA09]|jgi:hypothetical protein|nr:MAG: hypothetical protein DWQ58_11610 [Microcystis aeruginosa TA09]
MLGFVTSIQSTRSAISKKFNWPRRVSILVGETIPGGREFEPRSGGGTGQGLSDTRIGGDDGHEDENDRD